MMIKITLFKIILSFKKISIKIINRFKKIGIKKLLIKILIICPLVIGLSPVFISQWVKSTGNKMIINELKEAPLCQVAIIPGAAVYPNQKVSAIVYDRLIIACELYKMGKVQKILISADHGKPYYDEVNTIKSWVLKYGVKPSDIFLDHAGFSTYETMYRAHAVFQVKSALIVTQQFHLPRACYLAKQKGIQCFGIPCDQRKYAKMKYNKSREWAARVKDWIFIHILRPNPLMDNKKYPIDQDGRITWD